MGRAQIVRFHDELDPLDAIVEDLLTKAGNERSEHAEPRGHAERHYPAFFRTTLNGSDLLHLWRWERTNHRDVHPLGER